MIIHSYENGPRSDTCVEYLRGADGADLWERIELLPIPSTRDNKTILNTKISINEVVAGLNSGVLVCGYGLPDAFATEASRLCATVFDLSLDEEFLLENAELTALATIAPLLGGERISPKEMTVGIVGYGRIGKRLTNLLLYLGASVRVFTSRTDTRLDLCRWGVATAISSSDADLSGLNVLINTAPAVIFAADAIPKGLRIIDLASGDNFPGIPDVEKYPSLPAKAFPISAGRAWGRAVERFIQKKR